MTLKQYFDSVYHQFYRKVEETDFFINLAADNYCQYKNMPIPKNKKFLDIMQYLFSAFLSSLESCWEITKLTQEFNSIETGMAPPVSEKKFRDKIAFNSFFTPQDDAAFYYYHFMKDARNASIHDGSLALNKGKGNRFYFMTNLIRFKKENDGKYHIIYSPSPPEDAFVVMLKMALVLVPLFESKLIKPKLNVEECKQQTEHMLSEITDPLFKDIRSRIGNEVILSMMTQALTEMKSECSKKQIFNWQK